MKKYETSIKRTREGNKNAFYGKKHSEETIKAMSDREKAKGSQKGELNYFYGKRGESSPNWKGGKSPRRVIFYGSLEWSEKRFEIMKIDGFKCSSCGYAPKNNRNSLNVHHIIPLSVDWEKRLENENLITLCVKCHKETFGYELNFISKFQDIVRTSRRLEETNRNDSFKQEIV